MNTLQAELSILWPALIAGVLVVLSHVPLGQQVLARGIVFIDLAIAQVAGLGVIAAHSFGLGADRLDHADRRGRGGTGGGAAAHLDRAQAPGGRRRR